MCKVKTSDLVLVVPGNFTIGKYAENSRSVGLIHFPQLQIGGDQVWECRWWKVNLKHGQKRET